MHSFSPLLIQLVAYHTQSSELCFFHWILEWNISLPHFCHGLKVREFFSCRESIQPAGCTPGVAGWVELCRRSGWGLTGVEILKFKRTGLVFRKFQGEGGTWLGSQRNWGEISLSLSSSQPPSDGGQMMETSWKGRTLIFPRSRPATFQGFRFRHSLVSSGLGHFTYFRTSNPSFLGLKNKGGWRDKVLQG